MPLRSPSARPAVGGATIHASRLAWRGPRLGRPGLVAVLALAGLLACVYLGLRLTPLSAVDRVTVVGVQGPNASKIREAIERAATGQSTLGFHDSAVRDAVAGTPSITGVDVHTRFPHGVQVEVHQLLAVGAVQSGGRRVAVSADGRLLPDWTVGTLPVIRGARTADGALIGGARSAARILGAAPAELLARVARIDDGHTVRLASGPALLFRDDHRLEAKWAAAVAVLSDPRTKGATWIDLRVPEQPVAGRGAPPTLPARDTPAGKVTAATDALATAEGDAAAEVTDGTAPASAATATSPAAAPATARAATPSATPAAPADGTAAAVDSAPAATTTQAAPAAATPAAPSSGGATATTQTPSTGAPVTPDSAGSAAATSPPAAATQPAQSGGVTAGAAETAP